MSGITTHVLDVSRGRPAAGVPVTLATLAGSEWTEVAAAATDANGRLANLLPGDGDAAPATYRLRFDVAAYFKSLQTESFYPYVEIVFTVRERGQHFHVPLLVSPYGYTTYRGS